MPRGIEIGSGLVDGQLPEHITLDQAFRAAYFLTEGYLELEAEPDAGLVLFHQYLRSDPARWADWQAAVRRAMSDAEEDPLAENLRRDQ
jgi:hypothetical protein